MKPAIVLGIRGASRAYVRPTTTKVHVQRARAFIGSNGESAILISNSELVTGFLLVRSRIVGRVNDLSRNSMVGARHAVRCGGGAATKVAMRRELVWVEQQRFQGFGCSECGWRFKPAGRPPGMSLDEVMNNFELQRDQEFASHVCADHTKSP